MSLVIHHVTFTQIQELNRKETEANDMWQQANRICRVTPSKISLSSSATHIRACAAESLSSAADGLSTTAIFDKTITGLLDMPSMI